MTPTPGPWKKCSFYTIRRDKDDTKPVPHKVNGYTDGIYNYYATGDKHKEWFAILPRFGVSVACANTRCAVQAAALAMTSQTQDKIESKSSALQTYANMIEEAQR